MKVGHLQYLKLKEKERRKCKLPKSRDMSHFINVKEGRKREREREQTPEKGP